MSEGFARSLATPGVVRTFTLHRGRVTFEAWRAPFEIALRPAAQPIQTPWGVTVTMRPGTWAVWDPKSQAVVLLVTSTAQLKALGRLT